MNNSGSGSDSTYKDREIEGAWYIILAETHTTAGTTTTLMVLPAFEYVIYNNNLTQRCIRMKEKNYQGIDIMML